MIVSTKTGIITSVSDTKTKAGRGMLILAYSSGNSNTLQKLFLFEDDENYQALRNSKDDLIGTKISQKLELL